jgi:2-methylcitrate dehydratase PrpD
MQTERALARFVRDLSYDSLPEAALQVVRQLLLATSGTAIAGGAEDGIEALREMLLERGGRAEATVFVFGDRLPAPGAALLNGTMCRALDYCDAMAPGMHIGSSLIAAAFAAAELRGACTGREFIAALAAGTEVSSRMNLTEAMYDGFDPTGITAGFAAAAAAARLLDLDETQTHHALALAFNRCGGSFQSMVDGALSVRLTQGWVAETGVLCALYAQRGLTGPLNFIDGVYGYRHLYGRDRLESAAITSGLGDDWRLAGVVFKKFPSCGVTQGATELTLGLVRELNLTADRVRAIEVRLPPYAYRLVGHPFKIGENPRVDAQFSVQYCVANAIVRGSSKLEHFRAAAVGDAAVRNLIARIGVVSDEQMNARGHAAVDVSITTDDGRIHKRALDIPPGFPGNGLSALEHRARFDDCIDYAQRKPSTQQVNRWLGEIERLEYCDDVRSLIPLLIAGTAD